jgi:hypothetical protein
MKKTMRITLGQTLGLGTLTILLKKNRGKAAEHTVD